MNKLLNANKVVLADSRESQVLIGPGAESLFDLILKLPTKAYNAIFTPMGRKNVHYFIKRNFVKLNADYRRNGTLIYPLANGNRFVLHRGNQLSELVFLEGAYEPLETLVVTKVIQSNDVVLDLGANVGYFTALLDRLVKTGGQVHAFEPGEGTFAKLEKTRQLLKLSRAVLHPKAVGDTVGPVDFWSSTSGSDAQQKTVKNAALGRHLQHNRVDATTLDAFMAELQAKGVRSIAFVKCDIEGAEPLMLKGAKDLLNSENPPIWLIEHNRLALFDHGASSSDLLAPFANCDIYYVPICWPPSLMASPQASRWRGAAEELPDECNLIVIPRRGTNAKRATVLKKAGLIP